MKFDKCGKCGRWALLEKSICKNCYRKHFLVFGWYLEMGKVKIPNITHFIDELVTLEAKS